MGSSGSDKGHGFEGNGKETSGVRRRGKSRLMRNDEEREREREREEFTRKLGGEREKAVSHLSIDVPQGWNIAKGREKYEGAY